MKAKIFAVFLLCMVAIVAQAAIYRILSTDLYVNGMPPNLTRAQKAKWLDQVNISETNAAIEAGKYNPITTTNASKKVKELDKPVIVVPTCIAPQVLNVDTNKCENPPPPVCVAPQVLNPATNKCETPVSRGELDPMGANLMPYVNTALVPKGSAGFSVPMIKAAGIPPADTVGAFRISCEYSHMNNDDPIVFPGVPNATHHHTFFGNTGADAYSTTESLLTTGNSTCAGGILNRSGYWMPTLVNMNTKAPAKPDVVVVYYKGNELRTNPYITAPPKGLRMIAGEVRPMRVSQGKGRFFCQDNSKNNEQNNWGVMWADNHIKASCGGENQMLRMIVNFPQCWDGKNLDSPDHKSHMAFVCGDQCLKADGKLGNTFNACPASHPVLLPTITINADFYRLDAAAKYRLSSDNYSTAYAGGYSLHADWMNGWDEGTINRMVKNCLINAKNCGGPNLGDGQTLYGVNQD